MPRQSRGVAYGRSTEAECSTERADFEVRFQVPSVVRIRAKVRASAQQSWHTCRERGPSPHPRKRNHAED